MISGSEEAVYETEVRHWVLSMLPLTALLLILMISYEAVYDMSVRGRVRTSWAFTRLARAQCAFHVLEGRPVMGVQGSSESPRV